MSIKTVCFDLGGVLFEEGKKVAMRVLGETYGYDTQLILPLLKSPLSHELRKGRTTDEIFWQWAADQLPSSYDIETIRREWYDGYRLDKDIFELVRSLRGRYRVALFSGNIRSRIEYLDAKYGFKQHFDQEIYSFDHGVDKGDPGVVEFLIQQLGDEPNEIIQIDDDTSFLAEVNARGAHGLFYETGRIQELRTELAKLDVVSEAGKEIKPGVKPILK